MKFKNLAAATMRNDMRDVIFPDILPVMRIFNFCKNRIVDGKMKDERIASVWNDRLLPRGIQFRESETECSFESKLDGTIYDRKAYRIGQVYKRGDMVYIEYFPGMRRILDNPNSYTIFVKFILPMMGHELIHVRQEIKSNVMEMSKEYMRQPHELMAFAYVITSELYRKFKNDVISMRECVEKDKCITQESPHLKIYVEEFVNSEPEVLDMLKEYIYGYMGDINHFDYFNQVK
jgi:hypothetical protein